LSACFSSPPAHPDGIGAFRVTCGFSHASTDDPIAFPNQPGAAHLHLYFGNEQADAFSTAESLMNAPSSTCHGDTLNRSAYWIPSMLDANGKALVPETMIAYYKSGHVDPNVIQDLPAGLGIIAGNAKATSNQDQNIARWFCTTDVSVSQDTATPKSTIPNCAPGKFIEGHIQFPQCWNGRGLITQDQSHMAYPQGGRCPATHPIAIPRIEQKVLWRVPSTGTSGWKLSSDAPGQPRGQSLHADWVNGWHVPTMQRFVENCVRAQLNCSNGEMGDGTSLSPSKLGFGAKSPDLPGWETGDIAGVGEAKPIGRMTLGNEKSGVVRVNGWALDPNVYKRVNVRIMVDGKTRWRGRTDKLMDEPHWLHWLHGRKRSFSRDVWVGPGTHTVCAKAFEPGTGRSRLVGCKQITIDGSPQGSFGAPGTPGNNINVFGWAVEPEGGTTMVRIVIDGAIAGVIPADGYKEALGIRFPRQGPNHGFSHSFPANPGTHTVCATAINRGVGSNKSLGCHTVTV
jgi:hypothetical protein